MIFDVTLLLGQNITLEYDAKGDILEKSFDGSSTTISIPNNKLGKFTVIKDPVVNHVNLYSVELFDLSLDLIAAFKANTVAAIIIRIGNSYSGNIKNFNLHKIFIRPITLLEHYVQNDKVLNDIIIKGISLTANAVLLDSSFGAELEFIMDTKDTVALNMNKSDSTIVKSKSDSFNYTPMDPSLTLKRSTMDPYNRKTGNINQRMLNPGNLKHFGTNYWPGQVDAVAVPNKQGGIDYFKVFDSFENGAAAGMANLRNYINNKSVKTMGAIVTRWAPPSENDTIAYIQNIYRLTGIAPDQIVTEADIPSLFKAMSVHEGDNRNIYTDDILNRGADIAGIKGQISNAFSYGKSSPPITGTNVNKVMNTFTNTKGADLLNVVLQRMKEKYNIEINLSAMMGMVKSSFLYKNISLPGVTTLELLKKIHKDYPAYYMEVPWILDDMKSTQDANLIGKTWYTEIGILGINSLNVKSIWDNAYQANKTALYSYFNMTSQRLYYPETRDRLDAQSFVFKELPTGVETTFPAVASMEIASVPETNTGTQNSVSINKLKINTHKVIHTEASYTAEEFKKRLDVFKKHMYTNPQIVKCIIRSDDPNLIEFGYAYTFDQYKLNKITPYKIKMEFHNVEDQFQLTYEVDFYKGIDIAQS